MNFGLPENELIAIKNVFAGFEQIQRAIIYGSRAKGNNKPASDIDITIKGNDLNTSVLNQISNQLDDLLLPYTFDLSLHSHVKDVDLLSHIERVGKVFYEK